MAYDLVRDGSPAQADIFVISVDGLKERTVAPHPANEGLAGWSPDGKKLLFLSDRTESMSLWSIEITDGIGSGPAQLIKRDLGMGQTLGVSTSGSFYFGSAVNHYDIQIDTADFSTGQLTGSPENLVPDYVGFNRYPDWSPDGDQLVFVRTREPLPALAILTLSTNQVREIHPDLTRLVYPRWAPDGRSIAVEGVDRRGRQGIFLIDAENGNATGLIVPSTGYALRPVWSSDGEEIFFSRFAVVADPTPAFLGHNISNGEERELLKAPGLTAGVGSTISPDGRWLAVRLKPDSDGFPKLVLMSTNGGEPREVMRVARNVNIHPPFWAPDSSAVMVALEGEDGATLWNVPLTGEAATPLDWDFPSVGLAVHPDGNRIAFSKNASRRELWVLENFLQEAITAR